MSLIHMTETEATDLGRDLRESSSEFMKKRREGVGLSLLNLASMGIIALYQTGILKHVPEPPLPGLDADKVNGSAQAYRHLAIPDAVLGIGSYVVTLGLATMGPADRATRQPGYRSSGPPKRGPMRFFPPSLPSIKQAAIVPSACGVC